MNRKAMKKRAREVLKTHYLLLVAACLLACVLGVNFTDSLDFIRVANNLSQTETSSTVDADATTSHVSTSTLGFGVGAVLNSFSEGNINAGQQEAQQATEELSKESTRIGGLQIAYERGVLSSVVSGLSSGTFLVTVANAIHSVLGASKQISAYICVFASLFFLLFMEIFVFAVYEVIYNRVFLEARLYKKVPIFHMTQLANKKRWFNLAIGLLACAFFYLLWCLTIVGIVVKFYSYRMVPYVLAENPDIKPMEALTLSRKMMNGHKWECFKIDLSMFGWTILSSLTGGIVGLFYYYPYKAAVIAEYYAYLREQAKGKAMEGSSRLRDTYLFEKPGAEILAATYTDIEAAREKLKAPEPTYKNGVSRFFADVFGVVLHRDPTEKQYREYLAAKKYVAGFELVVNGEAYPTRLYPVEVAERKQRRHINFEAQRHYTVISMLSVFFFLSIFGWLFEVGMHFVTDGEFVNRGTMFGPWLPIYGAGSVLFLMLLNKFRDRPALFFLLAVIVAGCLEYFTSLGLDIATGGQKWWDYSGYFLNLNGRICAEGLLTFGVGGLLIVYLIAPTIDNLVDKANQKILLTILVILSVVFCGDMVYSTIHPNTGEGVTSVTGMKSSSN